MKAGTNPVSLTIEQQGKFAYVADAGGSFVPQGDIRSYGIKSPTGALSEIGITKIVSHSFSGWYHRVQAIAVDPSGNFLLAVDSHESVVGVYMIDKTTGTLTEADGSPFATGRGPVSVCVSRKTP